MPLLGMWPAQGQGSSMQRFNLILVDMDHSARFRPILIEGRVPLQNASALEMQSKTANKQDGYGQQAESGAHAFVCFRTPCTKRLATVRRFE